MKCYKLTDSAGRTHGDTQWGAGTRHEATGVATRGLCSDGWIHAYESPELAALTGALARVLAARRAPYDGWAPGRLRQSGYRLA